MRLKKLNLLAVTGFMTFIGLAAQTQASTGYVEIRNLTQYRACFGTTHSFYVEEVGSGSVTTGWECVDPQGSFRIDVDQNEYVYVSAVDDLGSDFLSNRLTNYSSLPTYAPVAAVTEFGVERLARLDGTWSYAFFTGENDWSDDVVVSDRDALDVGLGQQGFRKITGRVFRGADVVGGLVVLINF